MAIELEVQRNFLDSLDAMQQTAAAVGDDRLCSRLAALRAGAGDQKLRIAVIGEPGNGKSALVNSLLGEPLIPMGVAPITRVLTAVIEGPETRFQVIYPDGARLDVTPEGLAAVTEQQIGRLDRVELESPAPFLEGCIVFDVPGPGSVEGFDPHRVDDMVAVSDCVVFVLNGDRLLSLTERSYIQERLVTAGASRIVFVISHCDGKSPAEIQALTDRAQSLLQAVAPSVPIIVYSGYRALQAASDELNRPADSTGLQDLITRQWSDDRDVIKVESLSVKLQRLAKELEAEIDEQDARAAERLQSMDAPAAEAEAIRQQHEEERDTACDRFHTGIEAIRGQLTIGLKGYALTIREAVPRELTRVAVDDARRFLPFYIQECLRGAVIANEETVREALDRILSGVDESTAGEVRDLLAAFTVDAEPPAIPLYPGRERGSISRGATFVTAAATVLLFSEFYLGLLMLSTGVMGREIGRRLDAADRRVALASSAQSLVHGSIEAMERSIREQFDDLSVAIVASIQKSYASRLEDQASRVRELQEARDAERLAAEQTASKRQDARAMLQTAREALQHVAL